MKKEDEPDFYTMDKANPLPSLDEVPLPNSAMMPQMRQQQALGGGAGFNPMGVMQASGGMSPFKDSFDRDPLIGMSQQRQPNFAPAGMGMNMNQGMGMTPHPGMMNMGGMNNLSSMGALGGMNNMNTMNTMNGINSLRESQFPSQGMGNFGGQGQDLEFQRLRQIQQMQLLPGAPMNCLSNDTLARMQAENAMGLRLNRQPC